MDIAYYDIYPVFVLFAFSVTGFCQWVSIVLPKHSLLLGCLVPTIAGGLFSGATQMLLLKDMLPWQLYISRAFTGRWFMELITMMELEALDLYPVDRPHKKGDYWAWKLYEVTGYTWTEACDRFDRKTLLVFYCLVIGLVWRVLALWALYTVRYVEMSPAHNIKLVVGMIAHQVKVKLIALRGLVGRNLCCRRKRAPITIADASRRSGLAF